MLRDRKASKMNRKKLNIISLERDESGEIESMVVTMERADLDVTDEGTKLTAQNLMNYLRDLYEEDTNDNTVIKGTESGEAKSTVILDSIIVPDTITENLNLPGYNLVSWQIKSASIPVSLTNEGYTLDVEKSIDEIVDRYKDSDEVVFICGGAFEGLEKIIKERNKEIYNTPQKNEIKNNTNNEISEIKEQKQQPIVPKNIERKPVDYKLIEKLEEYGEVLNYKKYQSSPTIGREEEIMRLMVALAKDTTSPILIGESGVGKTAIADEIAYRISTGVVPKFLQDKIVLEINPETIASNTKYAGEFEAKALKLMKLVEENNVILLINEIHTIYGIGTTENNDRDLASIIKKWIDRSKIKIIGTTTKKEYDKYFSKDALKRRFDTIIIEEPNEELIYTIIKKVIIDYTVKKSMPIKDENTLDKIIEALIEVTNEKHRKYDDKLCNPALSISIIDQAFAFAVVFDDEYIEEHHFIKAIEWCERIYNTSKEKTIAN